MRLAVLLFLAASLPASAAPPISAPVACEPAIAGAERSQRTAPGLLHAIGLVESGRRDPKTGQRRPWPWTVTAEGVGTYYASKAEAIAAVQALQARGVASIDVGCMQVNLMYHPAAFGSLEQAFEPGPNAAYAARFLTGLYGRLQDWPAAAAAYHSLTPALGAAYGKLVTAVWAGAPVPVVQGANGQEVVVFPGGAQMRIFREASARGRGRVIGFLD
ncbi:MAG TPA: murein transglycosylase [Acetobacteraceae bacterium]|jgi:hypothetical protein|nr:murein transglycosylase [Acetobacteraceae bacterium]